MGLLEKTGKKLNKSQLTMNTKPTTSEEKLDYIYQTLKKQESRVLRTALLKWGFRIFILLYLVYFIKVWLPLMIDSMIPDMPSFSGTWWLNTESIKDAVNNFLNK
jgi:hypothetical protein